jgi:membrane protein CcdC involved in cytochrome C biogenesis
MKNKTIIITAILLILALGNYFRSNPINNIRNVDFLSIFAIGVLFGVLLVQIFQATKKN